ncbi:DUF6415 family natural product biosynthesis protein [Streptomyces sp. NPDC052114]|uniref:DUF6415 family natural product biosynthesis protein n=1 Tax=unclassified Streptomyces TaxID=2593676 RepID=UPI00341D972F
MTISPEAPPLPERVDLPLIKQAIAEATRTGAMPSRATLDERVSTLTAHVKALLPHVPRDDPRYQHAQDLVLPRRRPCAQTSRTKCWQYTRALAHAVQDLLDVAQQKAGLMTSDEQHPPAPQPDQDFDLAAINSAVDCALATPRPPRSDDILYTGSSGELPRPSVGDQTKYLLDELPHLLIAFKDIAASVEPDLEQQMLKAFRYGDALIRRRPSFPDAQAAHVYLQELALFTRFVAIVVHLRRDR